MGTRMIEEHLKSLYLEAGELQFKMSEITYRLELINRQISRSIEGLEKLTNIQPRLDHLDNYFPDKAP